MCSICLFIFASGVSICVCTCPCGCLCVCESWSRGQSSLALSCCCRGSAVVLATAALCKCNYRADTVWHPNWGTLTVFYDFGMSAFVCISLSPNVTPPCLFNPCAVRKTFSQIWCLRSKMTGLLKIACKSLVNLLLILYYHQILDLIFLSTCFLPVNTDFYLWTGWS